VWLPFDVYNNGDFGDYVWLTCSVDGTYVTSCSGPTQVYVDAWSRSFGDQMIGTAAAGSGGVSLIGSGSFGQDEGWYTVIVQGAPVVMITPDALAVGTSPSSNSGYGFRVSNVGTASGTISFSASCTGVVVTCSLVSSQVTLTVGQSALVGVKYTTAASGSSGSLTLHGSAGSSTDDGSLSVSLATESDISPLQSTALIGPGIDRGACLTIAAGAEGAYECGDLRLAHPLPTITTKSKARTPTFVYNSQTAHPYPLVKSLVTVAAPLPDAVQATLAVNGSTRATASYVGTNWLAGSTRQIVLGFDALGDATGSYSYSLTIQKNVGGNLTTIQTDTGHVIIVNRSAAKLGSGWWLAGVDRLINQGDNTKLFIGGDGSTRIYYPVTGRSDMWSAPQIDHRDYIKQQTIGGASYLVLYLPHGARVLFDAALGLHRKTVNRLGDTTFFAWNDSCEQLTSITVPLGHSPTYLFNYNAGTCAPLATVTQYAGSSTRTVSFTWDGGQSTLRSITDADGRSTQYLDDPSFSRRLIKRINTLSDTVYYAYDGGSRLRQVTLSMRGEAPISTQYFAAETKGLSGSVAADTALAYTLLDGPRTDVNDTTQFWLDRFGAPRRIRNALGNETTIVRGDVRWPGLATQVTDATGHVKQATYDAHGNLVTSIDVNPYGTGSNATTRYEWDQHWDLVAKIVAPMLDSTLLAYDPNNGNRLLQQAGADPTKQVSFDYTSLGLVRSTQTPGPPPARDSVDYDAAGNVRLLQSPMGKRSYVDRDEFGRDTLARTALNTSYTSFLRDRRRYNAIDRDTLNISTGDGAADSLIVRKRYDGEANLDTIQTKSLPDNNAIGWVTHVFTYDAAHRQRADSLGGTTEVTRTAYDLAGNTLSGGRENASYVYDVLSRPITRSATDVVNFTYDAAGRVLTAHSRRTRLLSAPRIPHNTTSRKSTDSPIAMISMGDGQR
jgi:YD repeat-containing protein